MRGRVRGLVPGLVPDPLRASDPNEYLIRGRLFE
jgi:hypothetical protein